MDCIVKCISCYIPKTRTEKRELLAFYKMMIRILRSKRKRAAALEITLHVQLLDQLIYLFRELRDPLLPPEHRQFSKQWYTAGAVCTVIGFGEDNANN